MPLSPSEKQQNRRIRLAAGGLFRIREFWVHPDDEHLLRDLEMKLREKRLGEVSYEAPIKEKCI